MWRQVFVLILVAFCILPVIAQSNDLAVITPDNVQDLAIVAQVSPEDFGLVDTNIVRFSFHPRNDGLAIVMQSSIPNGRNAILGTYDTVNNHSNQLIAADTFLSLGHRPSSILFSNDGKLLVSSEQSGNFIVWDMENEKFLFVGSPSGIPLITPDNQFLVIFEEDVAHVWDIELQKEVDRWQFLCSRRYIESPYITCTEYRVNGQINQKIYEIPSFDLVDEYQVDINNHVVMDYNDSVSPDGRRFVHFTWGQEPTKYKIYDSKTLAVIESAESDNINAIFVTNNDGNLIVYQQEDQLIFRNPFTNTDLVSLSHPTYGIRYQFGENPRYFVMFEHAINRLGIYGVTGCYVTSDQVVNMRSGAGTEFDSPKTLEPNKRFAVVGHTQNGQHIWWELAIGYWVREDVVNEFGEDCLTQ